MVAGSSFDSISKLPVRPSAPNGSTLRAQHQFDADLGAGVGHARDAAVAANVGRDPLQRHHAARALVPVRLGVAPPDQVRADALATGDFAWANSAPLSTKDILGQADGQ